MFDVLKYMDVAFPSEQPIWTTKNSIVYEDEAIILRQFREAKGISTLIVPPQAGHSSHIADYDNKQSLIATVLQARKTGSIFCIEWKSCTYARKNEGIDDLFYQIKSIQHTVGKAHIVGLCQGGWLATIYTALEPWCVQSLTLAAAPIDFHADGGEIYDTVTSLGMFPYKAIVNMYGGIMPGHLMLLGWKLMHPNQSFFTDYTNIIANLNNDKTSYKLKKFRTWYEHTLDLAGGWYLQAVEYLFLKNLLIQGEVIVDNRLVDLSTIKCPVAMITGEKDDITLPKQLYNISNYISSKKQYKITIPNCGHIGCFMGTSSQKYIKDTVVWLDTL